MIRYFKLVSDVGDLFHDLVNTAWSFPDLRDQVVDLGKTVVTGIMMLDSDKIADALTKFRAIYDSFTASYTGQKEQIDKVIADLKACAADVTGK